MSSEVLDAVRTSQLAFNVQCRSCLTLQGGNWKRCWSCDEEVAHNSVQKEKLQNVNQKVFIHQMFIIFITSCQALYYIRHRLFAASSVVLNPSCSLDSSGDLKKVPFPIKYWMGVILKSSMLNLMQLSMKTQSSQYCLVASHLKSQISFSFAFDFVFPYFFYKQKI